MTEYLRTIKLPEDLCRTAEKKYAAHFTSLEELIAFVLHALANDQAAEMDDAESRIIDERLRELGYLEPAS